jgi:uncharacterized protein (TIGR02270 family)
MSTSIAARAPLPQLVEESLEEALFLWRRWESELTSLTRNPDEVWSWTEDRLHGALAGVRVSADQLLAHCEPGLSSDDPADVSVSAALLAGSAAREATGALCAALQTASGEHLAAIARALEVAGSPAALSSAAAVLSSGNPAHAATLCRLKAFRGASPGREMTVAFESALPELQAEALRAARFVPDEYLEQWVDAGLRCAAPEVHQAAIESGVARGSRSAWGAALAAAEPLRAESAPCLRLVALLGSAEQQEVIYAALRIPALQTAAIWSLGHLGTRQAVECCLQGMQHEQLARPAGEAYCQITGADLARDRLAVNETAPETPGFEEEDLDADLVPQPESLWPLPDPDAVLAHWRGIESQYPPDSRHLRGQAATLDTLLANIETGPMLRRPDLILRLAATTKGRYRVEPRAFVVEQRPMMARGRADIVSSGIR